MLNANNLAERYTRIRAYTLQLASPLSEEDQCVQSMPDASPTKWHLGHTTWFFEQLVLARFAEGYRPYDSRFGYLFNSYYEVLGSRHPRPLRGLLTRPSLALVHAYRRYVDEAVVGLLRRLDASAGAEPLKYVELGLQHEQQHQELILSDILHAFSCNPLLPAYRPISQESEALVETPSAIRWVNLPGGIVEVGHPRESPGFAFDNEMPRHRVFLEPYAIADRLVTCGEFAEFIADGGYQRPELWLSDGWNAVRSGGWQQPLYWLRSDDWRLAETTTSEWYVFGLDGVRPLRPSSPVSHLSFYEAAAFAAWSGARLPTEFEWEGACTAEGMREMTGHVWQWTRSSYDPYPNFEPLYGPAAEYNGKFMVSQLVLRGGSCATPPGHERVTYRNFFPPSARWQFSGVRLARDI